MTNLDEIIKWAIGRHVYFRSRYGKFPYSVHLRLVHSVINDYRDLCPVDFIIIVAAGYCHDLMEIGIGYHEILKFTKSKEVAELAFALFNSKGRNRKEKNDAAYYKGIRDTPGAIFLKLCDRIANSRHAYATDQLDKLEMYRKENDEFYRELYTPELNKMFEELKTLLNL